MSRGVKKWSEERILELQKEGRGRGKGATYKPWVYITDFHSDGRTHEPFNRPLQRNHQLLSDGEFGAFLLNERRQDVIDIREQYPLDRDITQAIALEAGLNHQAYKGTNVPVVMTLDQLVTKVSNGKEELEAFSVKVASDLENSAIVERLEIERRTCSALGIPYHLVVKEELPESKVYTLNWIRDALLGKHEQEEWPGFFDEHMTRMLADIPTRRFRGALNAYCAEYDRRFSLREATGLRVARMLLHSRAMNIDLNTMTPWETPMECVHVSALPGQLRMVAGGIQ